MEKIGSHLLGMYERNLKMVKDRSYNKIKFDDMVSFEKDSAPFNLKPRVTIIKECGRLLFSRIFFYTKDEKRYDNIVLFYSKKNNAIMFKFITRPEKNSLKITCAYQPRQSAQVKMSRFYNQFDIDYKKHVGHYIAKKEFVENIETGKKEELWVIYLNDKKR